MKTPKLTEATFIIGLQNAYYAAKCFGVPGPSAGNFELRFDNDVVWQVNMPRGSTREAWDDAYEHAVHNAQLGPKVTL